LEVPIDQPVSSKKKSILGKVFCVFHVPRYVQTPQEHSALVQFVDGPEAGGEHTSAPCLGLGFVCDNT
jgi:hypothetical protein